MSTTTEGSLCSLWMLVRGLVVRAGDHQSPFTSPYNVQCSFHSLRLYFLRSFRFPINWDEGTKIAHIPPAPTHTSFPPSTSLTRMVHFLSRMNIHWHMIFTQSSSFTLGFIRGVVHLCGFRQMYNNVYRSLWYQSIFTVTVLKICALSAYPSLLP